MIYTFTELTDMVLFLVFLITSKNWTFLGTSPGIMLFASTDAAVIHVAYSSENGVNISLFSSYA